MRNLIKFLRHGNTMPKNKSQENSWDLFYLFTSLFLTVRYSTNSNTVQIVINIIVFMNSKLPLLHQNPSRYNALVLVYLQKNKSL